MLTLTNHLNNDQKESFTYDALNRLKTAETNRLGQGQYTQSYQYDPVTGNLSNKSDVGGYIYSQTQPHAVTGAGKNSYTYDLNGNMKTRTVAGNLWTYSYNAEGKITAVRKNGQLISEYGLGKQRPGPGVYDEESGTYKPAEWSSWRFNWNGLFDFGKVAVPVYIFYRFARIVTSPACGPFMPVCGFGP